MIGQTLKVTMLYDFYGALLTERQRGCIELHYLDDWSLAEVADKFSVSRQAVHDILKRSVQTMEELESKLKLIEAHEIQQEKLQVIFLLVKQLIKENSIKSATLIEIENKIQELLL